MKSCTKSILAALSVMIPTVAHAGPGANISGCIYLPTQPATALTVNFTVTPNHCMNQWGAPQTMAIPANTSGAGITCVSIGYVEADASTIPFVNTCGSDDSYWTLSYSIQNTAFTGSAETDWPKNFLGIGHNNFSLQNFSPNTMVCPTGALCGGATTIKWDSGSTGPLYIIFQPQSQ